MKDVSITLVNESCFSFLKELKSNSIDLALIDPPYEVSRETNFKSGEAKGKDTDRFRVSMNFGDWDSDFTGLDEVIKELYRVLRKGGTLICFYDIWKISILRRYFDDAKFRQIRFIEWVKTNPVPINSKINYLTNAREIAVVAVKVDTREWGEFRVGELFIQERGKEKAPKQNELGDCPLIQETNNNNGFDRMVVPTKIIKGNSITVSINYAQNVFYQADDFCASVNIAVLRNNHLNRYNSQFVCSVLRNAHQKFDYTSKISKELLNKEMIMLPVDKTGQPDWAYMEEYMRKVEEKVKNVLNCFEEGKDDV